MEVKPQSREVDTLGGLQDVSSARAEDNWLDVRHMCKCPAQAEQPYEDLAPSQATDTC